jgi:hypothetical protein
VRELHEGAADLLESDAAERLVAVDDEQVGEVLEKGEGEPVGVGVEARRFVVPATLVVPLPTVHTSDNAVPGG